jgi:TonB-linked SusC/RagA family outer membrane protein
MSFTKMIRVMKLIAIFLTAFCIQLSAHGFSQKISIDKTNAPLLEILRLINTQTGYMYSVNNETLAKAHPVTIKVNDASLDKVLSICFENQPLTYTVDEKIIIIREANKKAISLEEENNQVPPITVKGVITNESNQPVEGASIKVRGMEKGTSSNERGEFTLENIPDNSVLEISHISFEMETISIKNKTEIKISLKARVSSNADVVVNTGYQSLRVNQVTGSVTSLREEQLDMRVAPDIISKLDGIANGLVFNKDPLSGKSQLRVRGENTIYGYPEPLIVVDNFPYDGSINEINPNDVESINILKDAAAAAIWGARAGNGVIVITTKKGKANQPLRVELNANYTLTSKPDLFYSPIIEPSDYIDYEIYLFGRGKYNSDLNSTAKKVVSPVVDILNDRKKGLISAADSTTRINSLRGNDWRNEYLDHLYRVGVMQQYQLNLSGGGNKSAYYFSAGYDRNLASINGDKGNRITLINRTTYNPIKNLEIQSEINYIESITISNGISSVPNIYPYMRIADDYGNEVAIPQFRKGWEDTITKHGFLNWKYFPLQEQKLNDNSVRTYSTRIGTQIKYTFFKGLSFATSYQYYRSIARGRQLLSRESYVIRNETNRFAIVDAGKNYIGSRYPDGGRLDLSDGNLVGHNARARIDYNNGWRSHDVAVVAGIDFREVRSESNTSRLLGYDDANGTFATPNSFLSYPTYPTGSATLGDGTILGLSYAAKINRYRSFFTNALYVYKEKYSFSASARLDQANIFGVNTNNKGTPLWSVGGKWDISSEKFYNFKTVSNLALRVTYGYQGNLAPDAVAVVTLKYGSPAQYTGFPSASINNYPNPELRWEKLGQLNVALDFSAFKNRLNGSVDFFKKRGTDLIGDAPIDITTGVSSIRGNFSDMKSTGIDLIINSQNVSTQSFKWASIFIFNYAAETVTRYDVASSNAQFLRAYYLTAPKVDYPLHSLFSYRWGGLDPLSGDPRILLGDTLNKLYNSTTANKITFNDLRYNGRYNPPFAGSITNSLSWKNLMFTFNIGYKFGHYFRKSSIRYGDLENNWKLGNKDFSSRWLKPGDETTTNVPSFIYPNPSSLRDDYYNFSDVLIEKADHIRLQFINIGYKLDNRLANRIGFKDFNFYLYANNLGILWRANKDGIDPDYPYLGYPPSRTYSFGIKASF